MPSSIPATAQVLTRNSAEALRPCLDSLKEFAEVIVHDGYSTDATREIAMQYPNVRIMDQNRAYINDEGRITDFGAMRNESINAASHEWIFVADSNEPADVALINEIRAIVERNAPGVYEAFRRFYDGDTPIMHCTWYPALQIRLFHRSLVHGYVKPVHERLHLKDGVKPVLLQAELREPLPPLPVLKNKWDRYLHMEAERHGVLPWGRWLRWILLRNLRSVAGLHLRLARIWLLPHTGKRMPLSYEYLYILHSLRTIVHTFPPVAHARIASHVS